MWLPGVRRVGKTTLCRSLAEVEYFDCELPRTRRLLEDPEDFLASVRGRRIVLDEIHRLANPAEVLKVAADHCPDVRIVATGSSARGASGRKRQVWLTPMALADVAALSPAPVEHLLLRGGPPPSAGGPLRSSAAGLPGRWPSAISRSFGVATRAARTSS